MIEEKINEVLLELVKNLQDVESSRKQVEQIVNTYNSMKGATESFIRNLKEIKETISELVKLIRKDYDNKLSEFEKDRKRIVDSCEEAINNVNTLADDIRAPFMEYMDRLHKKVVIAMTFSIVTFFFALIMALIKMYH